MLVRDHCCDGLTGRRVIQANVNLLYSSTSLYPFQKLRVLNRLVLEAVRFKQLVLEAKHCILGNPQLMVNYHQLTARCYLSFAASVPHSPMLSQHGSSC